MCNNISNGLQSAANNTILAFYLFIAFVTSFMPLNVLIIFFASVKSLNNYSYYSFVANGTALLSVILNVS